MTANKYINSITQIPADFLYLSAPDLAIWEKDKPRSQQLKEEREALFKTKNSFDIFEEIKKRHEKTIKFLNSKNAELFNTSKSIIKKKRTARIITDNEIKEIVLMYKNLTPIKTIALKLRRGYEAISKILSKHYENFEQEATRRHGNGLRETINHKTDEEINTMIELYSQGLLLKTIGEQFGLSHTSVGKILKKRIANYREVTKFRQGHSIIKIPIILKGEK